MFCDIGDCEFDPEETLREGHPTLVGPIPDGEPFDQDEDWDDDYRWELGPGETVFTFSAASKAKGDADAI